MVSQGFSKESGSGILGQCLASGSGVPVPVRTDGFECGIPYQPDSVPLCFRPGDARRVMEREGFSYGLSLTLGSRLPPELRNEGQENVMCSEYSGNGYVVCGGAAAAAAANHPSSMGSAAYILQGSPFLKPAQQLLDEAVCVSNAVEPDSETRARGGGKSYLGGRAAVDRCSSEEKQEVQIRIAKLASLLDELESRCENYFHQMDRVVSSFEMVAGRGAAAAYTALTVQAMSKHFCNLRDAIIAQLNASRNSLSEDLPRNQGDAPNHKLVNRKKRGSLHHLGTIQIRQVWRPLRGLPEDSVALLRAWLFEHFLHPYPNDNEKVMLASQTGLTRNQISNWFINARVRLWKPMIEEMHREEFAEDMQESDPSSEL